MCVRKHQIIWNKTTKYWVVNEGVKLIYSTCSPFNTSFSCMCVRKNHKTVFLTWRSAQNIFSSHFWPQIFFSRDKKISDLNKKNIYKSDLKKKYIYIYTSTKNIYIGSSTKKSDVKTFLFRFWEKFGYYFFSIFFVLDFF